MCLIPLLNFRVRGCSCSVGFHGHVSRTRSRYLPFLVDAAGLVGYILPMAEHDHDHSEGSNLSEMDLRVRALETILVEKGYIESAALDPAATDAGGFDGHAGVSLLRRQRLHDRAGDRRGWREYFSLKVLLGPAGAYLRSNSEDHRTALCERLRHNVFGNGQMGRSRSRRRPVRCAAWRFEEKRAKKEASRTLRDTVRNK